jgi:hypothetical protein
MKPLIGLAANILVKDIAKPADSYYGTPSHRHKHRQDILK